MAEDTQTLYSVGVDIGSTTMKVAALDASGTLVFSAYRRHQANIPDTAETIIGEFLAKMGDCSARIVITGSVGMGYAQRHGFGFVQEVVAAAETVKQRYPEVRTFIDMGGEDSKMIFFEKGKVPDIRMNGSCAGGTGAFIDQTATLLNVPTAELNTLAAQAHTIHPIASRCGVFSKTDIQNLISRNISRADIAASVFNAVAMQVVASLARGMDITPKVFFCGGPFAFLPELQKHFRNVLNLDEADCLLPENAQLIPATGCALLADTCATGEITVSELLQLIHSAPANTSDYSNRLNGLFASQTEYDRWIANKNLYYVPRGELKTDVPTPYYLGVDSGSTTTKLVVLDSDRRVVYTDYQRNNGDSFRTFCNMLKTLYDHVDNADNFVIGGSCVTGYGENLIKTAGELGSSTFRERPYVRLNPRRNKTLIPDDEDTLKATTSYPSVHSEIGWGLALMLVEIGPREAANDILGRGFEYGRSRIIAGYSYPSDVQTGRLWASATLAHLHTMPEFQKLLQAAKDELNPPAKGKKRK